MWLFYGPPLMPADERPPIPFTPELEVQRPAHAPPATVAGALRGREPCAGLWQPRPLVQAPLPPASRPFAPTPPSPLQDPNWRAVYGEIEFECGHWGVFENGEERRAPSCCLPHRLPCAHLHAPPCR